MSDLIPRLLSLLLLAFALHAQPGVCYTNGTLSGCPDIGTNPSLGTYLGQVGPQILELNAFLGPLPQPKPQYIGAQLVVGSFNWFTADSFSCYLSTPNSCIFANATNLIAFLDSALVPTGTIVFWNIWLDPYLTAAECSSCASPPAPGFDAYGLTVYDAVMSAIAAKGLKLFLSFVPWTSLWNACGLDSATMTEAQMAGCVGPAEEGAVKHVLGVVGAGVLIAVADCHEPLGLWLESTHQTFSTADWSAFISTLYGYIKAASSAVKAGAGFTAGEDAYITAAIANNLATMDFGGVDAYPREDSATFATAYEAYGGWCHEFVNAGMLCSIDELGLQTMVQQDEPSGSETYANPGCGYPGWSTFGLLQAEIPALTHLFAAEGASWIDLFPSMVLAYQGTQYNSNCSGNSTTASFAAATLKNLTGSPAPAGLEWLAGGTWSSFQGFNNFTEVIQ